MRWTTHTLIFSLIFFGLGCSESVLEGEREARTDETVNVPEGANAGANADTVEDPDVIDTPGGNPIGGDPDFDPDPKNNDTPAVDVPYSSWAWTAGGFANDWPHSIASDDDRVFVGGTFETRFVVDGTAIEPQYGAADAFVIALDHDGNLLWHIVYGSPGTDRAMGLDVDDAGNLYVVGDHDGQLRVGGVAKPAIAGRDAHILKFGPTGTPHWLKAFGGDREDSALAVTASSNGQVTVVGSYKNEITVDRETFQSEVANGTNDAFVLNLDVITGAVRWLKGFHGWGSNIATTVDSRANGSIVVGVSMQYDMVIEANASWQASSAFTVGFVAYDADGALAWHQMVSGPGGAALADLELAADGTIYATGSFKGQADFGAGPFSTIDNMHDVWTAAWRPNGEPLWAEQAGGASIDQAMGIALAGDEVFVTGRFFDEFVAQGEGVVSNGEYDTFVVAYDASNGMRKGMTTFGGIDDELPAGIAFDGDQGFFVAGYTRGVFEYGGDSWSAPGQGLDAFVVHGAP